jgi:hypothetical protein
LFPGYFVRAEALTHKTELRLISGGEHRFALSDRYPILSAHAALQPRTVLNYFLGATVVVFITSSSKLCISVSEQTVTSRGEELLLNSFHVSSFRTIVPMTNVLPSYRVILAAFCAGFPI